MTLHHDLWTLLLQCYECTFSINSFCIWKHLLSKFVCFMHNTPVIVLHKLAWGQMALAHISSAAAIFKYVLLNIQIFKKNVITHLCNHKATICQVSSRQTTDGMQRAHRKVSILPLGQNEFLMGTMKGSSGIGFSLSLHEPQSMEGRWKLPSPSFLSKWHGVRSSLIEYALSSSLGVSNQFPTKHIMRIRVTAKTYFMLWLL